MEALRDTADGLVATIKVVPNASRSALAGRHGDALKVKLAAPPVDGRANRELVRFLAERAGLPPSAVSILRGETGRHKTVLLRGLTAAKFAERAGLSA